MTSGSPEGFQRMISRAHNFCMLYACIFVDSAQCAAPIVAETMPKSLRMCGADLRLEGVRNTMPLHSNLDSGTSKCDMLQELKKRV